MECDGASNENDDESRKTGNQCDACDSCVGFDGFAGADGPESFDGVDGMDGADGFDGFDGVDGGLDGFDGSDDVDGVDGVGSDGFDGLDGWGGSFDMEWIEKRDVGVCYGGPGGNAMELWQWRDNCRICDGTEYTEKLAVLYDETGRGIWWIQMFETVDDAKVKKELMGCQIWAMIVTTAWVATMALMVWMAQGGTDLEVPRVPTMVETNGGVDGWRRWIVSMVGVDGGLGSSAQRALTWKSLSVPSSDGDTHSGSFTFRLNSLQDISGFLSPCRVLVLWQFAACLLFTVFDQFCHDNVLWQLFSQQCCVAFDVTPSGALHSASKRKRRHQTVRHSGGKVTRDAPRRDEQVEDPEWRLSGTEQEDHWLQEDPSDTEISNGWMKPRADRCLRVTRRIWDTTWRVSCPSMRWSVVSKFL